MARFLTSLDARLIADDPPRWRLLGALIYDSAVDLIVVPAGFETDFASVPRLPLTFLLAGDTCHRAAVVHDWLYTPPQKLTRAEADRVLCEAAAASGVPAWRRWLVWLGVRVAGGSRYQVSDAVA